MGSTSRNSPRRNNRSIEKIHSCNHHQVTSNLSTDFLSMFDIGDASMNEDERPFSFRDRTDVGGESRSDASSIHITAIETCLDSYWNDIKKGALGEIEELLQKMRREVKREVDDLKRKYMDEMQQLVRERDHLGQLAQMSNEELARKENLIDNLLEGSKREKQKNLLRNTLETWHQKTVLKKKDLQLQRMADALYENKLKRKFFTTWRRKVGRRRPKLFARQDQTNNQTRKIHELERALKQADDKNEELTKQMEERQEMMQQSLLRGLCALNMETMQFFQSREMLHVPANEGLNAQKVETTNAATQSTWTSPWFVSGNPIVPNVRVQRHSNQANTSPVRNRKTKPSLNQSCK